MTGIISSAFRGVRILFSLLGITSSLGIAGYGIYFVVGGTTGGWAFIAMGATCLIPSIVMLRDAASILEKIKQEAKRLEEQNQVLAKNNVEYQGENEKLKRTTTDLQKTKDEYVTQNKQYLELLQENKARLEHLDQIKTQIENENEKLKGSVEEIGSQTKVYVTENEELKGSVEKINALREQFKRENSELQLSLGLAQEKLAGLEMVKDKYTMENNRLHEMVSTNSEQVQLLASENKTLQETVAKNEAQVVQLTSQVTRLKELHRESMQLLTNLKEAGDLFSDFGKTIGADVTDLTHVDTNLQGVAQELKDSVEAQIEEMRKLNAGLTVKLVEDLKTRLDTNHDGVISAEEIEDFERDVQRGVIKL